MKDNIILPRIAPANLKTVDYTDITIEHLESCIFNRRKTWRKIFIKLTFYNLKIIIIIFIFWKKIKEIVRRTIVSIGDFTKNNKENHIALIIEGRALNNLLSIDFKMNF